MRIPFGGHELGVENDGAGSLSGFERRSAPSFAPVRWRALLAHDTAASTCDGLVSSIADAFVSLSAHEVLGAGDNLVDIVDASSIEDARLALQRASFDVCFICLDLPPAPLGGVRLAQRIVPTGVPVILVTRSLRWLPSSATELRALSWVAPDASTADVLRALNESGALGAELPSHEFPLAPIADYDSSAP